MADSPYAGLSVGQWEQKTIELVKQHPLETGEVVDVVLLTWDEIFCSRIGSKDFRIGKDIYPQPQIMAFFLHELIPLEFSSRYPKKWRRDSSGADKDLVCVADESFSVEIKTSSSADGVYGNRSYAQPTQGNKKAKSGYYLAVNFAGFDPETSAQPRVRKIRFGWLDHSDWHGQAAATGQQAAPTREAKKFKLLTLFSDAK